jgi:hypothetical protein
MRRARQVARTAAMINTYSIFVSRPERERQLERTRSRWEDNIILDLREVG